MKRAKWPGFTLIELLVVVAIIALLISILLPSLSRARELSKRVVCGTNARAIGNACKIYATEPWNNESWPIPPFTRSTIADPKRQIYADPNQLDTDGDSPKRYEESSSDPDEENLGLNLSPTRAFWMLIRAGETIPKTYICPSSGDAQDDTEEIDRYYDFTNLQNISYGYQVPFGPFDTRVSENSDTRLAAIADKGPYAGDEASDQDQDDLPPIEFDLSTPPRQWARFNSGNHGGTGSGDGQNIFFADGHVDFEQTPTAGVDSDNIYTVMGDMSSASVGDDTSFARISGGTPQGTGGPGIANPFPGEQVFGTSIKDRATTDSLIWP